MSRRVAPYVTLTLPVTLTLRPDPNPNPKFTPNPEFPYAILSSGPYPNPGRDYQL